MPCRARRTAEPSLPRRWTIACSSPARRVRAAIIPRRTAPISLEWPRPTKRSPLVANGRRDRRRHIPAPDDAPSNNLPAIRLSRGTRGRCSAPAAHVSPQQLEVVVADLAAPRRHGGRLAIEHRIAEALEVVLGKLP